MHTNHLNFKDSPIIIHNRNRTWIDVHVQTILAHHTLIKIIQVHDSFSIYLKSNISCFFVPIVESIPLSKNLLSHIPTDNNQTIIS